MLHERGAPEGTAHCAVEPQCHVDPNGFGGSGLSKPMHHALTTYHHTSHKTSMQPCSYILLVCPCLPNTHILHISLCAAHIVHTISVTTPCRDVHQSRLHVFPLFAYLSPLCCFLACILRLPLSPPALPHVTLTEQGGIFPFLLVPVCCACAPPAWHCALVCHSCACDFHSASAAVSACLPCGCGFEVLLCLLRTLQHATHRCCVHRQSAEQVQNVWDWPVKGAPAVRPLAVQ